MFWTCWKSRMCLKWKRRESWTKGKHINNDENGGFTCRFAFAFRIVWPNLVGTLVGSCTWIYHTHVHIDQTCNIIPRDRAAKLHLAYPMIIAYMWAVYFISSLLQHHSSSVIDIACIWMCIYNRCWMRRHCNKTIFLWGNKRQPSATMPKNKGCRNTHVSFSGA